MAVITVQGITKTIKQQTIFHDISLTLHEGTCTGIIGHNGSGKSMIMKAICGFTPVDQGTITAHGRNVVCGKHFIKDTGVIIESPSFFNHLSGFKNLKLLAEIQNNITDDVIMEALDVVGLHADAYKKVGAYSLGMKQKLRIAQAMMEKPSILIIDEPFNGLDKTSVEQIQKLLLDYKNAGNTILLTSHDERQIDYLCDVVYELNNGEMLH